MVVHRPEKTITYYDMISGYNTRVDAVIEMDQQFSQKNIKLNQSAPNNQN